MRKLLYISFISLIACSFAFAQVDFATKAMLKLQEGDLATAKQMIDQASSDAKLGSDAKTWHYKAFIYKDFYKSVATQNFSEGITVRDNILEFVKKSNSLDTKTEYVNENNKLLDYISKTYFNDAKLTAKDARFDLSTSLFNKYKTIRQMLGHNEVDANEINYYLYVGSLYNSIALSDTSYKREYSEKAKNTYLKVIDTDPNNINANYNLAILYYNQAVDMIKELDFETDLIMLSQIQDESVLIFKKSLPYMERAHQLDPKNISTLKGLEGIYFSLNEKEKTEEIRKKIAELEGK
jgi:tetratricopeptide (TPR) repeat protein